jgi:hypothetical protein
MNFIPDLDVKEAEITYFEDSADRGIPGRGTHKNVDQLQREIKKLLMQLGAFEVVFVPGVIAGDPIRYGFRILFRFSATKGRIDCAALPMRSETPKRKKDALEQALYLVRNKLEAEYYSSFYEPGTLPLVGYLIGANGNTVTEELVSMGNLPVLGPGK